MNKIPAEVQHYLALRAQQLASVERTRLRLLRFLRFQSGQGRALDAAALHAYAQEPGYRIEDATVLRHWLRFLYRTGHLSIDLRQEVSPAVMPRWEPRRVPTHARVLQWFARLRLELPLELRDRAMLEMVYGSGLRASELVGLELADLDLADGLVTLHRTKNTYERRVPLTNWSLHYLHRYLQEVRPQLTRAQSGSFLWLGVRGKALHYSIPSVRLQRLSGSKKWSLHCLRHACATRLLEAGADLVAVQQLLGHRQLRSTQTYTEITPFHLRDVHSRCHPRAASSP